MPQERIARLTQDFSGGYHVEFGGALVLFSVSLAEAMAWAKRNKVELR